MKKQSHTVPRRRQSASPASRHLPLVNILIDAQAELQELVIASGLRVLEAMLEEDRAAVCGPRYAHQLYRHGFLGQPGECIHAAVVSANARRTTAGARKPSRSINHCWL